MLKMDEILKFIDEDLPYFDLMLELQNDPKFKTSLEIYTRDEILVSGSEILTKIAEILNLKSEIYIKSGKVAKSDDVLLQFIGSYANIHKA